MTNPDEDLLTTTEGVDDGSAASVVEGDGSPAEHAGLGHATGTDRSRDARPDEPAPPYDVETAESRRAQESGTGQQLEAGEG